MVNRSVTPEDDGGDKWMNELLLGAAVGSGDQTSLLGYPLKDTSNDMFDRYMTLIKMPLPPNGDPKELAPDTEAVPPMEGFLRDLQIFRSVPGWGGDVADDRGFSHDSSSLFPATYDINDLPQAQAMEAARDKALVQRSNLNQAIAGEQDSQKRAALQGQLGDVDHLLSEWEPQHAIDSRFIAKFTPNT